MVRTLLALISLPVLFLCCSFPLHAQQGVSISASGIQPDSTAILDLSSINKGFLVPRMTETQKLTIQNPAIGLMIFNTTTECFNVYKTSGWFELCGNCIPPVPPVAGSNSPVCAGDTLRLTASAINGALYAWTGPSGFTSTQQNPKIANTHSPRTGTYTVSVTVNGCHSGPSTTNVSVDSLPSNPSGISGPGCTSPGATGLVFSISPVTGANSYTWTVPSGCTITAGQNTTSVTVTWGSLAGSVCVMAANHCGNSSQFCKTVSMACPALTAWSYKVPVTINNTGNSNTLTDYQVNVVLNTATLVSAGKMKSDGSDIRFADSDSCTQLNYWIEKGMNGSSTSIWVKVPNISASSSKKIFMFYGNSGATAKANGDSTFIFFDDFNGITNGNPPSAAKWILSGSSTIQNGKMRLSGVAKVNKSIGTNHVIEGNAYIYSGSSNHDFRIDVLLSSFASCAAAANYIQYLIPWEGGDSRADNFNTTCSAVSNIVTGGSKYTSYDFRLTTYVSGGTTYINAYNSSTGSQIYNASTTWKTSGNYIELSGPTDSRYTDVENFRIRKQSVYVPATSTGSERLTCP